MPRRARSTSQPSHQLSPPTPLHSPSRPETGLATAAASGEAIGRWGTGATNAVVARSDCCRPAEGRPSLELTALCCCWCAIKLSLGGGDQVLVRGPTTHDSHSVVDNLNGTYSGYLTITLSGRCRPLHARIRASLLPNSSLSIIAPSPIIHL